MNDKPLSNIVSCVTGASRGAGRAIAIELGAAGATVYVTGRSTSERPPTDGAPGTVAETAQLVTEAGGRGAPFLCDHSDPQQVDKLFETIKQDEGRIDLLVNNAWAGYEQYDHGDDRRFWVESNVENQWKGMFDGGVLLHYLATRAASALMVEQQAGLIVSISAGDTSKEKYLGWMLYSVAKRAIDHLSRCVAHELKSHNVASLVLYPGFMATERVMAAFKDTPPEVIAEHGPKESPHYVGRAVVALCQDQHIMKKSGGAYMAGELAQEYGFTDLDGSQPAPFYLPEELVLESPMAE